MRAGARRAAILGAGTIGSAWAARFALMGWDVRVFDPGGTAQGKVEATRARARDALPALYDVPLPAEGAVTLCGTISETVTDADWIQEAASDRLDLKRKLFQQVQAHASAAAILASSSAGLTAAELQGCAARPGQILRACPVSPVYLIPQVLLEGTERTDPGMIARARQVLADIGLAPVEALSGAGLVATATEGAAGLAERDKTLVALLRSLKARGGPLAAPILAHEVALAPPAPDPETSEPPLTLDQQVPISWVDYNGHMNEARYLTAFSAAADRLLLWAGMDAACIAAGQSVFTVETHIRYLAEVHIGDRIRVTTRVLQGGGRKFHIWHAMSVGDILCATGEQLLLHVDLATRRSTLPPPAMARWLSRAAASHAARPLPEGMGRHVGQRSAT